MGLSHSRQQGNAAAPPGGPPAYPPGTGHPPGTNPPESQQPQGYAPGPMQQPNQYHPGFRPPPPPQPGQQQQQRYMQQQPKPQAPPQQLTKTATIRNSVNLKKSSLGVKAAPGNPHQLRICFTFDASAPCRVSTFVAATEDPTQGCCIASASRPWADPIFYDKGLGLQFPAGGNAQHTIDLALHPEGGLLSDAGAAGNKHPLIIRMETVTERGLKEGHTLEELAHGGPQQGWVQSQTTFASLGKGEEGEWEVRVLKQKIWVDGISYELQEIYGMDQAGGSGRAAGEVTEAEAEDRLCVICLVNERDTTVLPCRHMCMCHECAQELRKQTQRCPICRNPVESLLHIRLGNKAAAGAGTEGKSAPGVSPENRSPKAGKSASSKTLPAIEIV